MQLIEKKVVKGSTLRRKLVWKRLRVPKREKRENKNKIVLNIIQNFDLINGS